MLILGKAYVSWHDMMPEWAIRCVMLACMPCQKRYKSYTHGSPFLRRPSSKAPSRELRRRCCPSRPAPAASCSSSSQTSVERHLRA